MIGLLVLLQTFGTVVEVTGEVDVQSTPESRFVKLTSGVTLSAGSVVATALRSSVAVELPTGDRLHLGPASWARFIEADGGPTSIRLQVFCAGSMSLGPATAPDDRIAIPNCYVPLDLDGPNRIVDGATSVRSDHIMFLTLMLELVCSDSLISVYVVDRQEKQGSRRP